MALITGGYLAYKGQASLVVMMLVGFAGILAGDSLVFLLGRMGRRAQGRMTKGLLARHLTPERIAKVEAQFAKRGPMMVMIARFLPGVRAATFFVAGGAQMSYWRFLVYDGLAALLSAPLFVLAGHHFGKQINHVIGWAEEFHTWLIGATVVAIVGFALKMALGKKKPAAKPAEGAAETVATAVPFPQPPKAPAAQARAEEEERALG
ncbi:DedA protein [Vulgatibacter incomptus]|uniref:DedA protein n=1 Tax=Vulgatibacter incomptus TaxID=1391653 RepID=A0A0K1PBK3_9BACT|nr:DedA protein [Vulgatibacter incomptus]